MKVAVTYENGQVFQHFGHTENFQIFEIEDGGVADSYILETGDAGHEALAGFLLENGVNVLLCGGMGDGAKNALDAADIEVISGVNGDTHQAIAAYLRGELVSAGVNCDHHHDHDHGEDGCDCGDSCGGGCGGCGGGCGGGMTVIYEGPNAGKICSVHYTGTFNDGTKFDSSYDRAEPLQFVCGVGMMIPGFDKAVVNMEVGQVIDIHLSADEAYGDHDPAAVFTVAISEMPGSEDLQTGDRIYLQGPNGQPLPALVSAKDDENITFDLNSEMAGKELNFKIELLDVR